jgi:TetR/AcrR family transcriptional regulator, repressor for divergent bdcA
VTTKKIVGRGRPRSFDIDGALAIAKDLFHQRGFDGVGVAELSQAIGITAPSLYSAFGSKRQLFERVLHNYVEAEGGWLAAALTAGDSVEESIAQLFERAAEVYTANDSRRGCLILDGTRNCMDAEACALSAEFRQKTWQMICDRIAQEWPEQAPALANYVFTILLGMSAAARDHLSTFELQAIGQVAATGFSASLLPKFGQN